MAPSTPSEGGWTIIKAVIVLLVIDALAITLRFVARSKVKAALGMDDLWAILAFILYLANMSMNFWAVFSGGVGYPDETLTPTQIVISLQADWILTWLNFAMVLCVKLSVLFLYRRIFTTKGFRRVTLVFMVIIVLHLVILMLLAGFRCVPVVSNWNLMVKPTMCLSYSAAFLSGMTINAVIDACLLAMPFFMIRRLHMSMQRKLELAGIFALGAGTVVFSILRITQAYSTDPVTDNRVKLAIWSLVEPAVGLVCACLPTLRPLFPLLAFGRVRTWYSHRKNSNPSTGTFTSGRPSGSFAYPTAKTQYCPHCPHCRSLSKQENRSQIPTSPVQHDSPVMERDFEKEFRQDHNHQRDRHQHTGSVPLHREQGFDKELPQSHIAHEESTDRPLPPIPHNSLTEQELLERELPVFSTRPVPVSIYHSNYVPVIAAPQIPAQQQPSSGALVGKSSSQALHVPRSQPLANNQRIEVKTTFGTFGAI